MKNKLEHIDNIFSKITEDDTKGFSIRKGWKAMNKRLLLSELTVFNFTNLNGKYLYLSLLILFLSSLLFSYFNLNDIDRVNYSGISTIPIDKKSGETNSNEQKIEQPKEAVVYNEPTINDNNNDDIPIISNINTEEKITETKTAPNKEYAQNNEPERITDYRISLIKPNTTSILTTVETNRYNIGNRDIPTTFSDNNLNKTSRFSISMEIGYDISWKQLTSEPQFDDFKNYRIKNEKPITNLSYGLKFNYHYKNWIISAGLDYTSVGEEIYYNVNETIVDPDAGYFDVDTIWAIIYDHDNNFVQLIVGYDRTWIEEYKDINYKVENVNQYSYIEIPVTVGYNFAFRKFSVCPSAGLSFGFLYSASGSIPQINSTEFIELHKNSNYLQQKITNISFGLSLEYSITPNYGLYIKPVYKQGLNSIYKNYPLSGKYRNAGVKFGVSIYL